MAMPGSVAARDGQQDFGENHSVDAPLLQALGFMED
jgi:hypothetical protein